MSSIPNEPITPIAGIPDMPSVAGPVEPGKRRRTDALLAVLLAMVVLSATMGMALYRTRNRLRSETEQAVNLSQQLADLEASLAKQAEQSNSYAALLEQYQQIVRSYQDRIAEANLSINITTPLINVTTPTYLLLNEASVIAPAVRTVGSFQVTYVGVATTLSLEMIAGKGRVLVSTKPLMGEVFQDTAVLAKETAERLSGKSLAKYDLIFSIEAPAEIPAVDGPSAGAAMCLLVMSLINGKPLAPNVAVTGTINLDGTIGGIGGVLEKAQAAKEAGSTIFLVSEENSEMTIYKEGKVQRGPWVYRTSVPVQVSTEEYIEENVGIDVEFVHDVEDLFGLAAA